MEVYILNGAEVTLEELQSAANAAGISLEQFKVLNNVTTKQVQPEVPVDNIQPQKENFQTGVADKDAGAAPDKYPEASELESQLEELSLELKSLREADDVDYYRIQEKAAKQTRLKTDLQNVYDAAEIDFDEPRTLLRKGEDEVKTALKEKYPYIRTETFGPGNALYVYLPDGRVELDLDDGFMSESGRKQSIDVLNKLANLDKSLTAKDRDKLNIDVAFGEALANRDVNDVNNLLDGTGYELVQDKKITTTPIAGGYGMASSMQNVDYSYTLLKDGKPAVKFEDPEFSSVVTEITSIEEMKDLLSNDPRVLDALTDNAYKAQKEFILEYNKRLKEEQEVIQKNQDIPLAYYKNQFKTDLETLIGDELTNEDKGELYNHFQTIQAAAVGNSRKGRSPISTEEQIARYKDLSNLSPELRAKIINSGIDLSKLTQDGINKLTLEELGNKTTTIAENIIKSKGNQNLLNLAQRFIAEDEREFNETVGKRVEETTEVYNNFSQNFADRAQSIINKAPDGTKITLGYIGNVAQLNVENDRQLSKEEEKALQQASDEMLDLQFTMSTMQQDYEATLRNIQLDINQYYVNKGGVDQNVFNAANKEYNLGALMAKDVNDSFAGILLTVPTLFGSEWAIEEQRRLNNKNQYYETMLAYDDGDFLRYALRTTSQQSANLTLAIGTAGFGSAIGLTSGMTRAAIGTTFGLTSGTQTYRDLTLGRTDIVKQAKEQRARLESAYREGIIGEYEYTQMMFDVNQTIAMNDLTDNQILGASIVNGTIEGGITSVVGTAPNSIKLLKDFAGSGGIKTIANNVFKSNTTQLYNYIGKPLITRPLGEVLEETSIYGLQQYVTEYGLLDRDLDLSQLDDTAVSAIIVSGVSQGPGVSYSGIINYGKTKKFEQAVNKLYKENENLSKLIQNTTDENGRKALLASLTENLGQAGLEVDMLTVDMLNLGSDKLKRFMAVSFVKQDLLSKAGVTPQMTEVEAAEQLAAYKETLSDTEKKQFNDEINAVDTQINKVKDQIDKNQDFKTAENALGNLYTKYDATLDREGDKSKGKERIAKIIQRFRDDQVVDNIERGKSNPKLVDQVENMRVDQNGNQRYTKEGAPDKRFKLATEEQKNKVYAYHGKNQMLNAGRAFANKLTIDQAVGDILADTDLQVVGWKTDKQLEEILSKENLSETERLEAYSKLKDNKTFGLIVGNKIITQRPEDAQADLEAGIVRAGTVILHEISHAVDDGRITTEKGKRSYAENLYKAAATSDNAGLKALHQHTVEMLDDLYGPKGETFENSETYRDEYTKYLQEQAFAYENELQLEKDDNALVRAFNDLTTDANSLNTPKKALNYMLANNSGFRRGKLSRKSQQALKNRKATDIKFSERTLNEDARKYKADEDVDMASFLDQYTKLGLRALGYSKAKGDIATDEAIGFIMSEFPSITRNFDPDTAEFSTYATNILRQRGKGFYKQELAPKEGKQRITAASEATRLVAEETAEAGIELEERAAREKKTERRLINPLKSPEVAKSIKDIEDAVALTETKAVIADFKNISQDFGGKVASIIFNVPETKITDGTKNLTYAKKIVDGVPQQSEAGNIQNLYSNVSTLGRDIRLLPDTNVTSEESRVGVEKVPVTRDVQGRSLGLPNKIIKYFYEDTGKRSKGTTSQTKVYKKKAKFVNPTTEVIKQVQKDMGITPAGELNKYDRNIGQLLKGFAKVKGAVTAVAVAKNKVEAMDLRTAKPKKQIRADIGAGRSKVQFSEKINKPFFVDPSNTKWDVFDMVDVVGAQMFPDIANSDAVRIGSRTLFEELSGEQRIDLVEEMISNVPVKFSEKVSAIFDLKLPGRLKVDSLLSRSELDPTLDLKALVLTDEGQNKIVDTFRDEIFNALPRDAWLQRDSFTNSNANYGISMSNGTKAEINAFNKLKRKLDNEIKTADDKYFGKPVEYTDKNGKTVTVDFKIPGYATVFKGTQEEIKAKAEAFNIKVTAIHDALWSRFAERISKDPSRASAIGTYLKLTANDKSSWHRRGAAIYGYSPNPKGVGKTKYEMEHAMPATSAYLYLLNSAIENAGKSKSNFKRAYGLVMQNYKLIALDKAENKKLNDARLGRAMPVGWDLLSNFWWQRYFNPSVAQQRGGIDPAKIVDLDGRTFQDVFGINADGSKYTKVFKPNAASTIEFDNKADKAMANARNSVKYSEKIKKARVFDFDDTLARSKSMVLVTMPNGDTRRINATEFALEAATLEQEGAEFNFDEFSKVIDGKKGPLFEVAKKIQDARGSENIFILTARPAESAPAIKQFLSELGLNIPLKNITGLGDGKPQAKANWFVEKYGEGFNDFYFADDALKNVKAVKDIFDVLDVKGRVQQARVKFSEKLDKDFNAMIERNKGVKAEATFSDVVARRRGAKQKRFAFFIPPSADDFRGLTMYTFAGKGKQGEADQEFFDKALIKPYQRGVAAMNIAKTRIRTDYRALLNDNRDIRKKLKKKVAGTKFNLDQAIRVYLWTKEGYEIPGLSKRDQAALAAHVMADESLVAFAEGVKLVTRQDNYLKPSSFWDASTILGDLSNIATQVNRAEYLKEFSDNVDIIFSEKNLNKVEAIYGFRVREALENIIYRMKTGTNANKGSGRIVNAWNNWVNNSVGTIMFFNRRSALLQTISTVNFVNWSDNNPIKAAMAFSNQPQYWADFKTLWNSPKLIARRRGLESDLQEAEIAKAAREGGAQGVISYLLKIGFTPTQLADSFAIAAGGATFYRNRINTYKKQGMTTEDAEAKAFEDFSSIADETQQSADPMLISSQQASVLGRLVLAFQNTPMQYTRLIKKAGQDLINRRGNPMTNISKIIYYGFVQNLIFSTLQNAMFALLPGFDDEEEDFKTDKEREKYFEKEQRREDTKIARTLNSMVDTILRGSGLAGAVASTIKNVVMEYSEQKDKTPIEKENADIIIAALNISPPIGSKVRKLNNFLQTEEFEKDVIAERGFDVTIDGKFQLSPTYDMVGELSSALLNLPLDRAVDEVNAITEALDSRNTSWQRLALAMGWRQWDVNARVEEHDLIKTHAKTKRKEEGKVKAKETREKNKLIEKENKRIRIKVFNALPNDVRIELQKQERKTGFKTPVYKLKQYAKEYNIDINE